MIIIFICNVDWNNLDWEYVLSQIIIIIISKYTKNTVISHDILFFLKKNFLYIKRNNIF